MPIAATSPDDDSQALLDVLPAAAGSDGGSFDGGIDLALRRILASPKFVFRVERDPAGRARPAARTASAISKLASRLSFFLWSSIPDDELLDLAEQGDAAEPGDARAAGAADAGRSEGAGARRQLRRPVAAAAQPARQAAELARVPGLRRQPARRAAQRDELFFSSIMREDRSVLDLMTADYTFVNERLARHYGIPYVYGSHFRRVTLPDDARRGLLGKGAHSDGDVAPASHVAGAARQMDSREPARRAAAAAARRRAAVRGRAPSAAKPRSVRERMEQHRRNPACASCHRMMDPAGLALENFDAVGAWRTRDGGTRGTPIDASGQLVDGTQINGVRRAAGRRCPATRTCSSGRDREAADLRARPRA